MGPTWRRRRNALADSCSGFSRNSKSAFLNAGRLTVRSRARQSHQPGADKKGTHEARLSVPTAD